MLFRSVDLSAFCTDLQRPPRSKARVDVAVVAPCLSVRAVQRFAASGCATAKEKIAIRRPMRAALPVAKDGPRINDDIREREVHLIDRDGANRGTVSISEALALAQEAGLDLVEISPNAKPPVCKLLDFGKYKFQEQKKQAEARKKQKIVEIKEVKFRPMIDDHDYDVKMRSMIRFFGEGDKVKVTDRKSTRLNSSH